VESSGLFEVKISNISSTMLITLYCRALESRSPGIRLMDEWSYFDSTEKMLGQARFIGAIPWMRRV